MVAALATHVSMFMQLEGKQTSDLTGLGLLLVWSSYAEHVIVESFAVSGTGAGAGPVTSCTFIRISDYSLCYWPHMHENCA